MYIFVEPVEGFRVMHPHTGEILDKGRAYPVQLTQFWAKKIQNGEVKVVEKPSEPKPEKKKKES